MKDPHDTWMEIHKHLWVKQSQGVINQIANGEWKLWVYDKQRELWAIQARSFATAKAAIKYYEGLETGKLL